MPTASIIPRSLHQQPAYYGFPGPPMAGSRSRSPFAPGLELPFHPYLDTATEDYIVGRLRAVIPRPSRLRRAPLYWAATGQYPQALARPSSRWTEGRLMRSRYSYAAVLMLAVGLSLAGCGQSVDPAAEEQKIRALDQQWIAAVAAKDAGAVANFYASDGAMLSAGAPIANGTDAIAAAWKGLLALKNVNLTFAPTKVTIAAAGDLAYEVGTYALGFDGSTGPVKDQGKYVVVWKKVDGTWKVAADIYNTDLPAP